MVGDTNPESATKCCSKCGETKDFDKFIPRRNICKQCSNARKNELIRAKVIDVNAEVTCSSCTQTKPVSCFLKHRKTCSDCNNSRRKDKYKNDEENRRYLIQKATEFKQKKAAERRKKKLDEIGEGNKKCSTCQTIKPEDRFRHNRLKCKDCERDDPVDKFKRTVRTRIWFGMRKLKDYNTIHYLGCSSLEYQEWILHYDENYTLENHGKEWHIDHVIPLSRFTMEDKEQQLLAFNWRNTMPLSCAENLSKNSKIVPSQIEQQLQRLVDYHKNKNMELPQVYIDLFAKHLVDGKPLKPSLPLSSGNIGEEHG